MLIANIVDVIDRRTFESIQSLAQNEARLLVHEVYEPDSPLLPLAREEVRYYLAHTLEYLGHSIPVPGGVSRCGVMTAFDDKGNDGKQLAGFIQYKSRGVEGAASIGYSVVAPGYRGKGVFKQMLAELRQDYPLMSLDCALELVLFYETLGFRVIDLQATHVAMTTMPEGGKLPGYHFQPELPFNETPLFSAARDRARTLAGKSRFADLMNRKKVATDRLKAEVRAFVASRLQEQSRT